MQRGTRRSGPPEEPPERPPNPQRERDGGIDRIGDGVRADEAQLPLRTRHPLVAGHRSITAGAPVRLQIDAGAGSRSVATLMNTLANGLNGRSRPFQWQYLFAIDP